MTQQQENPWDVVQLGYLIVMPDHPAWTLEKCFSDVRENLSEFEATLRNGQIIRVRPKR